jgi:mRNA interferase MazF
MPSFLRSDVILVRYPFTDLSGQKVRLAVVVHTPHSSQDLIVVPLTSRTAALLAGVFVLGDWAAAGLNVPSAAKRGVYTVHPALVVKPLARLTAADGQRLDESLRLWLGL